MIDLRHLPGAAELELRAYEKVLRTRLLSSRARATIEALHTHEQAHARALVKLGARRARRARPHSTILSRSLGSEGDCLLLLIAAEDVALGACYDAIEHVSGARELQLVAEMMAAEAQHRTVLSELRSPRDVRAALPASRVIGIG